MFLNTPNIVCNNPEIRAILARTAQRFTNINMPIIAFVGVNSKKCDSFITKNIERRHVPTYYAMSGEEREMNALAWVGAYPPISKYVLLINEVEWLTTFYTTEEMTGCIAHELAHMELWSNADTVVQISRRLADRVEASKSSAQYSHTDDYYNAQMLGSNEYVTDALAVGRGFGRELSAGIKALQRGGRASERNGMHYREIDELLLARDIVNYRIAKKNEVLRHRHQLEKQAGTNTSGLLSAMQRLVLQQAGTRGYV